MIYRSTRARHGFISANSGSRGGGWNIGVGYDFSEWGLGAKVNFFSGFHVSGQLGPFTIGGGFNAF